MGSFYKDNDDIRFYVERGIDWEPLVALTEYDFNAPDGPKDSGEALEFYRDILELVGGFVADEVAPHGGAIDRFGVQFKDGEVVMAPQMNVIFDKVKALDLHGLCVPRELGGHNCPLLVFQFTNEMFSRADASVVAHHGFHGGMAMAMLVLSIREGSTKFDKQNWRIKSTRFGQQIEEIRRGDAWGCMDITEPDAGSDMAALRCKAELDVDGVWRLSGQKIFITAGHGRHHFVIARSEQADNADDPFSGLSGLSMFLVPTYELDDKGNRVREHVTIGRVEEKLGQHGSATCSMNFDNAPAQLVGKRGEGFAYMLTLMNNARIGVGFESLGLSEAAHRCALAYARERTSMGKTIDKHEMIADYLDEMAVDIAAVRALSVHCAWHEELAAKHDIRLRYGLLNGDNEAAVKAMVSKHKWIARRGTPLLKYIASENAVKHARWAIQLHGGVGYTREYEAERLLRDAMVMPIYEGTSQIQALMAMKDSLMWVIKHPQAFATRYAQAKWRSVSARDPLERSAARVAAMTLNAMQHLVTKTALDKVKTADAQGIAKLSVLRGEWNPKSDFAWAMLHAERLIRMLADNAIADVLLEQAKAHPDRRWLLEAWLDRAEPRCHYELDVITTKGARIIDMLRGRQTAGQRASA
jgi:3-(methylthio)propanoyl-CoA dehydrogenase